MGNVVVPRDSAVKTAQHHSAVLSPMAMRDIHDQKENYASVKMGGEESTVMFARRTKHAQPSRPDFRLEEDRRWMKTIWCVTKVDWPWSRISKCAMSPVSLGCVDLLQGGE
jgi:hypothetical protein